MTEQKKSKSNSKEDSQNKGFSCCDANFESIFEKMKEFCGDNEKSSDCCTMMQKMSCNNPEKPQK
jgi:hypothetical protein